MEDKNSVDIQDSGKKKYRISDRLLSSTGELDWPLFLTLGRIVQKENRTFQELTEHALLENYAPVAVLVDQLGNMRYVHGHIDLFLESPNGYMGINNVLKLTRNKLRRDLNITLHKAVTKHKRFESPEVSIKKNGKTHWVKLTVIPLHEKAPTGLYLIVFETKKESENKHFEITRNPAVTRETSIGLELSGLHHLSIAEEAELVPKNTELEKINEELKTAQNKLYSVKENIYRSELELEAVREQIDRSNDELNVVDNKILEANDKLEAALLMPDIASQELTPINQDLEMIKDELNKANQELYTKKEELNNLDQAFDIKTQKLSSGNINEKLDTDVKLEDLVNHKMIHNNELGSNKNLYSFEAETVPANDKGMGFFSKKEMKPLRSSQTTRSFGFESDSVGKKELKFKDAFEFMAVADHGFRHDSEIKSVIIPEGVEIIKRSMFYKCTQLERVSFPNSVKVIEDFAFYGCERLDNLELNNCLLLESIGTSAFEGCTAFSKLVIPDSVMGIEEACFLGCKGIETVEFQGNSQLEFLGSHAFKDCVSLKKIVLPDHLKQIGSSCFYGCYHLSEIHLSGKLETVGEYAFWGCDTLREIAIPNKKLLKQPGFTVGFPKGIKV